MNLYELGSFEFVEISHLVKIIQIALRSGWNTTCGIIFIPINLNHTYPFLLHPIGQHIHTDLQIFKADDKGQQSNSKLYY